VSNSDKKRGTKHGVLSTVRVKNEDAEQKDRDEE